jgi:hypothetical protein
MRAFYTLLLVLLAGKVLAQQKEDLAAIKQMCGCYEVKFNFAETFAYPTEAGTYKPSPVKQEVALEWVELVEESPRKVVLQHLLIVNDSSIVKHWRQDWLYEHTAAFSYNGFNDWKRLDISKQEAKGTWVQKVYQVDDSPRYEGWGTWVHQDGRHYWESTAMAPLPRREFTQRSDYNILQRRNRHEITRYGWLHEQDNNKIVRNAQGQDYLLAQEKGIDTYTKVPDSKCLAAQQWWRLHEALWAKVRQKWHQELSMRNYVQLKKKLDEKPLFMHLFALKPNATQEEVNKTIENFFEQGQ